MHDRFRLRALALEQADLRGSRALERGEAIFDRYHLALRRFVVELHLDALLEADDVRRRFELE